MVVTRSMAAHGSPSDSLPASIVQGVVRYLDHDDVYSLLIASLEGCEYQFLCRDFLLMPGVLDVLPASSSFDQQVFMSRSKYDDDSSLFIAATEAHVEVMRELVIRCEEDSKCNTIWRFGQAPPALPWIIAD